MLSSGMPTVATSRSWPISSVRAWSATSDTSCSWGDSPTWSKRWARPQSVTEALRAVAHHGTALLLGAAGISEVDLTPIWYKEISLVGSIDHGVDSSVAPGLAGGPDRHSVDRAIDILAAGLLPDVVVTHEFGLEAYRQAIETAIDRSRSGAIKVVFRPATPPAS